MIQEISICTIILIWSIYLLVIIVYSTPCLPRHLLHFTTLIDTLFPINFTLFYFTSYLVLPFLNFLSLHYNWNWNEKKLVTTNSVFQGIKATWYKHSYRMADVRWRRAAPVVTTKKEGAGETTREMDEGGRPCSDRWGRKWRWLQQWMGWHGELGIAFYTAHRSVTARCPALWYCSE